MRTSTRVDDLSLRVQQLSTQLETLEIRSSHKPDPHDLHMRIVKLEHAKKELQLDVASLMNTWREQMQEGREADHQYRALRPEYV